MTGSPASGSTPVESLSLAEMEFIEGQKWVGYNSYSKLVCVTCYNMLQHLQCMIFGYNNYSTWYLVTTITVHDIWLQQLQ